MRDGWVGATLGEISKCAGGCAFPDAIQGHQEGIPFIKVSDMNLKDNEKYIETANNFVSVGVVDNLRLRIWDTGTVIFPKVGAALLTEKRRILTTKTIFDNNIMGLVPNERVLSEYLYLLMLQIRFSDHVQQGAVPSIKNSIVEAIKVLIPSLDEQKRIVDLISSLDSYIECAKELINKAQTISASLSESLWHSFKLRSKLSSFGDILTGSTPPTKNADFWDNHDLDFFTPSDMGESLKLHKASRGVSSQGAAVSRQLSGYSVLQVCIGATIGKIGFLDFAAVTNQQINAITNLNEHDAPVLAAILSSETFQSIIKNKAGGSTLPIISKSSWSDIEIPYVPENERAEISNTILELDAFIEQVKQTLLSAKTLRTSTLSTLLNGNHEIPASYDKVIGAA